MEDEREAPSEIALDACYGSDDTRGEENTGTPAHADIGGDIRSEDSGDNLGSVCRREGLDGNNNISWVTALCQVKSRRTWKTPHETPHIASPKAKTGSDGAKTGIKIITVIHAMKIIMVIRQPNRSWQYAFTNSPASWPTTDELDRPDCQAGLMRLVPDASSNKPNRFWNCDWA